MKERIYIIAFTLIISAVASTILTFTNSVLKERIERNQQLEIYRAVLEVLRIPVKESATFKDIENIFNERTKQTFTEREQGIDIYEGYDENRNLIGYAVKISGPGFWGPIAGFISIEPDMKTIRGITFHSQEETPGLGGRIVEDDFKAQFIGKSIYDPASGRTGFKLTPPGGRLFDLELVSMKEANEVDSITGATETSSALQKFMNYGLENFTKAMQEAGYTKPE